MKILFLDLDGTVRKTKSGATFINDPYDQELIPEVEDVIALYHDYKIIGVTNQGGVIAGYKSLENCFEEQRQTLKLLPQMSLLLFCTDNGDTMFRFSQQSLEKHGIPTMLRSSHFGNFRKPNPGMIVFGMEYYSREKLEEVLMVGDEPEDQQTANNTNIPFMWAEEWRNGK